MSRLGGNPVSSPVDNLYEVPGRILGGSGVATIAAGKGFSLTYVSTGRYRITPDVNFPYFTGAPAVLFQSGGNYYTVKAIAYSVNAGSGNVASVDFLVANSGTATDLGATDELWFSLSYARTTRP